MPAAERSLLVACPGGFAQIQWPAPSRGLAYALPGELLVYWSQSSHRTRGISAGSIA
jgi:hypothetical protein